MSGLFVLPPATSAFSEYRPSSNAHTDFLGKTSLGKRKDGDKSGPRVVKLSLPGLVPQANVQDQKADLLNAIPRLLSGQPTAKSYHHLSEICHRLVLPPYNSGEEVYDTVRAEMGTSAKGLAREWTAAVMSRDGPWLARLVGGWERWERRINLLSAVLTYLDRVYAASAKVQTIKELSLDVFRETLWNHEVLRNKTKDELRAWVEGERSTEQPDAPLRSTIGHLTAISKTLSVFHTLSDPYLETTGWYYEDMAVGNIQRVDSSTMPPGRYVQWVLDKAQEERDRAIACLDADVAVSAVAIVRSEAGFKQKDRVVRRALDEAMDAADIPALTRLYRFCVDCDAFATLVEATQQHIRERLTKLISDPSKDPQMIEGTLTLKRFIDKALASLFQKSDDVEMADNDEDQSKTVEAEVKGSERNRQIELEDAVRLGFKAGIGSRQNAPAEWIAKHLDSAMRKGQGSGTEAEFNTLLDEIISLVGYTRDKDVFKAFYSTQLAKRLLLNKSASDDMERTMILKLQKEMGEEFTSGDVMMKDLALSETLVKSYQQAQAKNPDQYNDPGSFTANVLTESAWPAYPLLKDGWNFKLTPELQTSIDQFTQWYSSQHKNRQLSWRWQLATVSLTARFPSGRYEIGVSLFQAVTLLQFNDAESLSFKDLKAQTGIEHSELVRTVQSLAMGRKNTRVLLKKPPGKEVNPDDLLIWNKGFSSDRVKFKINSIQQDLSSEESKQTNEQVAIDRVSVLEATIVRIMKGKKTMTLQLLIDAVVTEVSKRFPPDIKDLKKRVESLIEREFLMRDEDDRNVLKYLA